MLSDPARFASTYVIPTEGGDASDDLQKRFREVLGGLDGRTVGTDALFEVLRLEVLDWALDNDVAAVDAGTPAMAPALVPPGP